MKRLIYATMSLLIISTGSFSTALENFSVILEPKWKNLEHDHKKSEEFGGKWILVGSITFEKKSKEYVSLDKINLCWNGESIDNLIGSLYKKIPEKEFIPIQDNLISDGNWNKTKQTLILKFDKKLSLGPTTTFYLVLTVPETIEFQLKSGSFCIEEQCLPDPFKHCAHNRQLSLAINTTNNLAPSFNPKKTKNFSGDPVNFTTNK